jgi:peptidoglycan/xylan/chitin deacetylase (PgdA/CDA1 family)
MKATLTYHSIDDSGSPISVSPEAFKSHLQWLASGRVRVLSLDDLVALPDEAGDALAVTFDDGFLNTRVPVEQLLAAGLPVSLFIVSRCVGGTNAWGGREQRGIPTLPLLGWADLEALCQRGAGIECHTRTHPSLTGLSDTALEDELGGSAADLRDRLGAAVTHLAYPYGDVDETVSRAAARQFRFAHTTEFRLLTTSDAPHTLPRLDMYYFRQPSGLESWGTPRFQARVAWYRGRRALRARLPGSRASRGAGRAHDR